jgi:hypothetical protein
MLARQAAPTGRNFSSAPREAAAMWLFAAAGAFTFVIAQMYLFATAPDGFADSANCGWFLNASRGVWTIAYAVAAGAAAMSFLAHERLWLHAFYVAGVVAGMTVVLLAVGPGTIFPIVIAIGTVIVLMAVICGSFAGYAVNVALRGLWQLTHRTAR